MLKPQAWSRSSLLAPLAILAVSASLLPACGGGSKGSSHDGPRETYVPNLNRYPSQVSAATSLKVKLLSGNACVDRDLPLSIGILATERTVVDGKSYGFSYCADNDGNGCFDDYYGYKSAYAAYHLLPTIDCSAQFVTSKVRHVRRYRPKQGEPEFLGKLFQYTDEDIGALDKNCVVRLKRDLRTLEQYLAETGESYEEGLYLELNSVGSTDKPLRTIYYCKTGDLQQSIDATYYPSGYLIDP